MLVELYRQFFISVGDHQQLEDFYSLLNTKIAEIQFTMMGSRKSSQFLDTLIHVEGGQFKMIYLYNSLTEMLRYDSKHLQHDRFNSMESITESEVGSI